MDWRNLAHLPEVRDVIIYGYSLGTAIAAYVSARRSPLGIVLAAPPSSAKEMVGAYVNRAVSAGQEPYALAPDLITAFDEAAIFRKINIPLLVIHGIADQVIPVQ